MQNIQTEKKVEAGIIRNNLLINQFDRTNQLANQIFSRNDYAKKQQPAQRFCACGNVMSRDWVVFNSSERCQSCETARINALKVVAPVPVIIGKKVKLSACHSCYGAFGPAKMRDAHHCVNCETGKASAPKIEMILGNFLHSQIQASGGSYAF